MNRFAPVAIPALLALALGLPCAAQAQVAPPAALPPIDAPAPASRTPDARIEHLVTEDTQVRIDEVRVRGQMQQIVVHSKLRGMGSYEIAPAEPGRDPADDLKAGKRIWLKFDF